MGGYTTARRGACNSLATADAEERFTRGLGVLMQQDHQGIDPTGRQDGAQDRREGSDVRETVRVKIANGRLPVDRPTSVLAYRSKYARACMGCDRQISPGQVGFEQRLAGGRRLLFHEACLAVWHQERAPFLEPGC